jgi:D-sedoheptulose 7-phosphate isomerase
MIVPLAIVAGGSPAQLDTAAVGGVISALAETQLQGRPTVHSGRWRRAANAAHAVNDFRKIAGLEAYAPPLTTFRS